jgi:uncharacterized protein
LNAAHILASEELWNECVSRLSYACFHAARALLLSRGYRFRNHRDVQILLNERFVHIGLIAPDLGDLYNKLFVERGRADYEPYVRFDASAVRPWIAGTERFIRAIDVLLESGAAGPQDPTS